MENDPETLLPPEGNPSSPRWNTTTKLIVGLSAVALIAALFLKFKYIVAPLLVSLLLAYLLYPVASFFHRKVKIPWRLISLILYLLLFLAVIGLLTWGGISLVEQVQNLIKFIQGVITDLPGFIAELSSKPLMIGPFPLDLSRFDVNAVWAQVQGIVEPLLTNLGGLIGSLAGGIGSTVTWTLFIILISFFIMAESGGARRAMVKVRIPNYQEDFTRLGNQLAHIWNAFLRGQLLIFAITVAYYSILLSILGLRYFFLLALLAGLARFVPYVGPFVAWTTYGLLALFQTNYFGLQPFPYALLVVGCALLSDVVMDYFVSPRVMSDALSIHPAAVLVMVIVSASLFGVLGVLLAAPVLASLKLIAQYVARKLTDQDPWEGLKFITPPKPLSVSLKKLWKSQKKNALKISGFFKRLFAGRKPGSKTN